MNLRKVLLKLEEEARLLLIMIDLEGNTYKEVSDIMILSENSIRMKLHRARLSFKELYAKSFESETRIGKVP